MSLREYLIANMFDGVEAGTVTADATTWLDEICENVALWLIEQSGVDERIEHYYTGKWPK